MCQIWNGGDPCVESLDSFKISQLKLFFLRLMPCLSRCMHLNKEEQLFEEGRKLYEGQVNIVEFMKTFRELKAVVKEMIGREGTFIMEQTPELGYVKERQDEDENRTNDNNEISIVYNEPLHEKEAKQIFSRKRVTT